MKKYVTLLVGLLPVVCFCDLKSQIIYTNASVQVSKVIDSVYLLKETVYFPANVTAVKGNDSILLIDTGFEEAASDLSDAVDYLNNGTVKYIINTHGDGDHVGANASFDSNAKTIVNQRCNKYRPNTIAVNKSYSFFFNGGEVRCMPFPYGHSACDMVIYFPSLKIACLGDIYLSESFPTVGLSLGSRAYTAVNNLKMILDTLPDDVIIIPGHGRVTTHEDLKNYIDMLEETIAIVRAEMQAGKSLTAIKNADVLSAYSQWGTFFSFITKDTWIEQIYASYPVTSIDEGNMTNTTGFGLFPNPTTGIFSISFGSTLNHQVIIEIYDLHGNLLLSQTFHNTTTATIDITGFPAGMYVVKVIADGVNYEEKLIIE